MTCEAMFAETLEDVQEWSKLGYLGVEMEAAMMFALSNYFHIPSASLLYVADNLIEDVTIFHDGCVTSKEQREAAKLLKYEVAVAELIEMPFS
jgi:purine-nucleoside phosphorylase